MLDLTKVNFEAVRSCEAGQHPKPTRRQRAVATRPHFSGVEISNTLHFFSPLVVLQKARTPQNRASITKRTGFIPDRANMKRHSPAEREPSQPRALPTASRSSPSSTQPGCWIQHDPITPPQGSCHPSNPTQGEPSSPARAAPSGGGENRAPPPQGSRYLRHEGASSRRLTQFSRPSPAVQRPNAAGWKRSREGGGRPWGAGRGRWSGRGAPGPSSGREVLGAWGRARSFSPLGVSGRSGATRSLSGLSGFGAERSPLRPPGRSSCGEGSPGSCPLSRQPAQEVGRCLAEEGTPRSCHVFLCLGT